MQLVFYAARVFTAAELALQVVSPRHPSARYNRQWTGKADGSVAAGGRQSPLWRLGGRGHSPQKMHRCGRGIRRGRGVGGVRLIKIIIVTPQVVVVCTHKKCIYAIKKRPAVNQDFPVNAARI